MPSTLASADAAGSPIPTPLTSSSPALNASPAPLDLSVDANGLSKSTVVLNTTEGVIKFKFYSQDAPNTVKRIAELIQKGFYNGLTFHRVVPNFVIQGGDPTGTGAGGSGQKLKAEFNSRHHVEGTVAMARANDPDSADSQFYISLGTLPHLDNKYTVFGQVIEGMDVARKIKVDDKMTSVVIQ
jgi:cyclophilin family peptidyl-prolyl cis-trans isomerase